MRHREIAEFGSALPVIAALGIHPDVKVVNKFGQNRAVSSGTAEDLWSGGGDYGWLAAASSLEVVSADAADAAAGTGARTVHIYGLDENWELQDEIVTMNGTTAVALTGTYTRCFRAHIESTGTGQTNAGLITVRVASGGATVARIEAGDGQTLMAIYTIPDGWYGLVTAIETNLNGDAASPNGVYGEISLRTRDIENGGWRKRHTTQLSDFSVYRHDFYGGFRVNGKTDLRMRVDSVTGTSRNLSGYFTILLFRDS